MSLLERLKGKQDEIDSWIASAAKSSIDACLTQTGFKRDLQLASQELLGLAHGDDVCYDRPGFGPAYALWFQGRRVNQALAVLAGPFANARVSQLHVFDLGAGAGAVMTALLLLRWARLQEGGVSPEVRVVNIDYSPFMLDYARRFLQSGRIPGWLENAMEGFNAEFEVCAWQNAKHLVDAEACWICASYLFDHAERTETLTGPFKKLVTDWKPDLLWLSTSWSKAELLQRVTRSFESLEKERYRVCSISPLPFSGHMQRVNEVRAAFPWFHGATAWDEAQWSFVLLESVSPRMVLSQGERTEGIAIYNMPIRVRREITLNDDQKAAATLDDHPKIIVGPAGCGKSIVITEAIKNAIEELEGESHAILVTTFNKSLVWQLKLWLEDLLDAEAVAVLRLGNAHYEFRIGKIEILLMHFDILPTRLGEGIGNLQPGNHFHENLIADIVSETVQVFPPRTTDPITRSDWILDEFHRVVYAQQIVDEDTYLQTDRVGRGQPGLRKGGPDRLFLWQTMRRYREKLQDHGQESIITRRWRFLEQLKAGHRSSGRFRFVFVDEFQDCTRTDFDIFDELLSNRDGLIIAGDLAQAVHIGATANGPRRGKAGGRANFKTHELLGSYRLPYWVSRSARRVSQGVIKTRQKQREIEAPGAGDEAVAPSELAAWKCAPPGARPIIVFGATAQDLAAEIQRVVTDYALYEPEQITILELDTELVIPLNAQDHNVARTDTIMRLKGLEKRTIVWSTSAPAPSRYDIYEIVYTILTRTACLLLIALSPQTRPEYLPILRLLDRKYLIFADDRADEEFQRLISSRGK